MTSKKTTGVHIDIQELKTRLAEAREKIDMLRGYL